MSKYLKETCSSKRKQSLLIKETSTSELNQYLEEYQNKDTVLPKYGDECHHSTNAAIGAGKLQDGSQLGLPCEISSELNT